MPKIWRPSARQAVVSHMGCPECHNYDETGLTADQLTIIDKFVKLHRQYERSQGTKKLSLFDEMDTVLKTLDLSEDLRLASINRQDAFDLF